MSAPYTWPTEFDDAQHLLQLVGSFWADTYAGNDLVAGVLHAKAQTQAQAHLDLLELLASMSRFTVPVFHTENWTLLPLRESELNATNLPKFNGAYTFNSGIRFDAPQGIDLYAWSTPAELVTANVITNRITDASVTYTAGSDFYLSDGAIWFHANPFMNPAVRIEEVFDGTAVVDRIAYLWVYRGQFDLDTVYTQFGYVLGVKLKSSQQYRALLNASFDGLVAGTSAKTIEEFMSAVCDVPLALGTETVRYVLKDTNKTWVVTDINAYSVSSNANVTVAVGDTVKAGDPFTDTLQFYDLNRGTMPSTLNFLSLSRGMLFADYTREIGFANTEVPLVVIETPGDYTRVEFELTGWPGDLERFWDETHARGVAANQTLAMLLDTRANKTTQPTAMSLPLRINPLKFLCSNLLRGNAFVITVRPVTFGPGALGLAAAKFLSKLIPPQTVCILLVTLEYTEDIVTMDRVGTENTAGCTEDVRTFLGNEINELIDPLTGVSEDIRVYQIEGYCT